MIDVHTYGSSSTSSSSSRISSNSLKLIIDKLLCKQPEISWPEHIFHMETIQ